MLYNKNKKTLYLPAAVTILILSLLIQGCGNKTDFSESPSGTAEESTLTPAQNTDRESAKSSETTETTDEHSENDSVSGEPKAPDSVSGNTSSDVPKETETAPAPAGSLRVNGTRLVNSNGTPVQLKGISTHGLAWFPDYINKDCFRQLKDEWNVNVIRLAMYTSEYGGYCNGGNQNELKALVKNGVEYATALNMYVIIDWHILSDSNPNIHKEDAKAFFAEMAQLYTGYDNVLYEICNEPNGGTSWQDIKSYAEEVIPVIRSYDKDGIIIVGTPNWSQYVDQAAADPVTGYDNIMYALHFYAATHTDSLRNTMKKAIDAGLPVFVTEYGICDASGNGAIDENQANQWVSLMDQYGVSYVAWNLSNKNETSAILSSSCSKTSNFTKEDLSASGKWLYQMLTGKNADTLPKNDTASDNTPNTDNAQNIPPVENSMLFSNDTLSITATLTNSWESEGKTFYQYDLTIFNTSDTTCNQWTIDVNFSNTIALSDGWNGDYSANGQTLRITCKDYNRNIPAGSSTGNIGFIISSNKDLKIIS